MSTVQHPRGRRIQRGLTLVELMVALVVGLLITIAAVASLIVGRIGFTSVDSSTQLRESARFAANVIQRVVDESGFQDVAGGQFPDTTEAFRAGMFGYDNALVLPVPQATPGPNFPNDQTSGSRNDNCGTYTDTSCMNGSDILVVRYWGVSNPPGPGNQADGSVVNCAGGKEPERASGPSYSVFSVMRSQSGEPTLVCTYQDPITNLWNTVALVSGVESFQVLYGAYDVTPATCATPPEAPGTNAGRIVPATGWMTEAYYTSGAMNAGGAPTCPGHWARVRTLRIGMVLRGPVGSAVLPATTAATIPVFSEAGTPPYTFQKDGDNPFLTVPADGRLREQVVFNITMRNMQVTR